MLGRAQQSITFLPEGVVIFENILGPNIWKMTLKPVGPKSRPMWGVFHGDEELLQDLPFAKFDHWGDAVAYATRLSSEQMLRLLEKESLITAWTGRAET